jgi:hypothetical protein
VAEVLDKGGRLYLAVGIGLGLLMQPLSPGDPERQLARHVVAVERLLERTPVGSREQAAQDVGRYMRQFGPSVARLKEQLRHYNPARSVAAYRRIEGRLRPLMDSARSHASPELYRLLLDLLP